jgi:hypothetical protein
MERFKLQVVLLERVRLVLHGMVALEVMDEFVWKRKRLVEPLPQRLLTQLPFPALFS